MRSLWLFHLLLSFFQQLWVPCGNQLQKRILEHFQNISSSYMGWYLFWWSLSSIRNTAYPILVSSAPSSHHKVSTFCLYGRSQDYFHRCRTLHRRHESAPSSLTNHEAHFCLSKPQPPCQYLSILEAKSYRSNNIDDCQLVTWIHEANLSFCPHQTPLFTLIIPTENH